MGCLGENKKYRNERGIKNERYRSISYSVNFNKVFSFNHFNDYDSWSYVKI